MTKPKAKSAGEKRLQRTDWEDAALQAIERGGLAAAAVEPLARSLGVTKGSFYWHFPNGNALLEAALSRWEAQFTEGLIAALSNIKDPRERLVRVITQVTLSEGAARFHTALAASAEHVVVRPLLARVTKRRIGFLWDCFRELGSSEDVARRQALVAYAAYLGLAHMHREAPQELPRGKSRELYAAHLVATLLAAPP